MSTEKSLGNLPVERAKDTVCFLQRGGVSLASSAIIYNIVKVKVTCWPVDPFDPLTRRPVDPFDPLTRRPVDLFEKEALKAIARSTYIHRWDVTRLTRRPVDPSTRWPFRKRTLKGNCEVHLPTLLRCSTCSKRRRIRLCCLPTAKQKAPLQRVAWGWHIYNIVESENDPLTFSKKNPSRANGRSTYIHPPSLAKIRQRTSEYIGNKQTNKQTLLEL